MSNEKTNGTATKPEQPAFLKRIGTTTYLVHVHFSKTSKETMSDKVMRLIQNDVAVRFGAVAVYSVAALFNIRLKTLLTNFRR